MQINIANHEHPYVWDGVYGFALSDYCMRTVNNGDTAYYAAFCDRFADLRRDVI